MFEKTKPAGNELARFWNEEGLRGGRADAAHLIEPMRGPGAEKISLPRGSAETRYAPPQYYYLASKSGVVPSWAVETRD